MRRINEECGVFGVFNSKNASSLVYYGLHALQHRGQEAAGIAISNDNRISVKKSKGLVSEIFNSQAVLDELEGSMGIGHVRYSTSGNNRACNVQPFVYRFKDYDIALAHNGNLVNAESLKKELENQGAIFNSTSDSEVLIHLIRRGPYEDLLENIKYGLNIIKGGFTYLLMGKDTLYGAVDPSGLRPLVIGKLKTGNGYVLTSETCALDLIGASFYKNVEAGEIVIINKDGLSIERYIDKKEIKIAAMEYIYFSRPDSDIFGKNVHAVRKRSGKILAKESPVKADMVVGVPNSSLSAANGYAEQLHLPLEMGLIKNQYTTRTFIQPNQILREKGVRMKLSAVKSIVKGKDIVLVDDSIVRGTTSKRIVTLLREAQANKIHLRIASPEFIFPSFYGIDLTKSDELISAQMNKEELREYLGADSLEFLSVEGLLDAVDLDLEGKYRGLCLDSFTGDYPEGLGDYKEEFLRKLTKRQKEYLKKYAVDINKL